MTLAFPVLSDERIHFSSIQIELDFYVIGGTQIGTGAPCNRNTKYSLNGKTKQIMTIELNPMKYSKIKHSMALYKNQFIYIMGGQSASPDKNIMTICEKYSIINNKWSVIPSLNYRRLGATACIIQHFIYIIGGYVKFKKDYSKITKTIKKSYHLNYPQNIESLDLSDEEAGWKPVNINIGNELICNRLGSGSLIMSPFDILIFGGQSDASSIRYETVSNEIKKTPHKFCYPLDGKYRAILPFYYENLVLVTNDYSRKKSCWHLDKKYWAILQ